MMFYTQPLELSDVLLKLKSAAVVISKDKLKNVLDYLVRFQYSYQLNSCLLLATKLVLPTQVSFSSRLETSLLLLLVCDSQYTW